MLEILPVENRETYLEISKAAAEDNHYVLAPTHYWKYKDGKIAGYYSNGKIPVGHFWMSTKASPRMSYEAIKACEAIGRASHEMGMIACAETSPFFPKLESHFGYKPLLKTTLLWVPM